jgi:hypothetical protein
MSSDRPTAVFNFILLCILRGYTPLLEETLDPANQTEPDTKEGLYFGLPPKPGSEDPKAALVGPNQWPSEVTLPHL